LDRGGRARRGFRRLGGGFALGGLALAARRARPATFAAATALLATAAAVAATFATATTADAALLVFGGLGLSDLAEDLADAFLFLAFDLGAFGARQRNQQFRRH